MEARSLFKTHPETIESLLIEIEYGKLALPEFQRDFIWAPENTASLLSSIIARYPAGSLLTWHPSKIELEPRAIFGAPPLKGKPERLVLDGQQRLTALYRAIRGKTEESYFLNLRKLIDTDSFELVATEFIEWDAVIQARPLTAKERRDLKLKTPKEPDHRTPEWQYEQLLFPLGENFDDWYDGILDTIPDQAERKRRKKIFQNARKSYLDQLEKYEFPVINLTDAASLPAVCMVFEKLNTNSVRLGPFEILTAKFFKDISLRKLWESARAEYPVLRDPGQENDYSGFSIDPYLVLQIITLIQHQSPQRKAVLNLLSAVDLADHWEKVIKALVGVIEWLRDSCGVVHRDLLPYQAVLVPLTGAWIQRNSLPPPKRAKALEKIRQYFWASVFTTNFDQGAASQSEKDYHDLRRWLHDLKENGKPITPEVIDDLQITADSLLSATAKKKALLQGLMALTITCGARDFFNGEELNPATYVKSKIQSHHLYPKARLEDATKAGLDPEGYSPDLILNRAMIGADTNKRIGAAKPSKYVADMEATGSGVTAILESHLIDKGALECDSYEFFLKSRLVKVIQAIESQTGKTVEALTIKEGGSADDQPAIA
ncbi:DUF262 domain-containing protein [Mycobacterium sp. 852002-10029_SCH5224772]|uniref:DUF262 domain-containing protein n=1 Tax=Mycobacterium sp. 852002-10029_SCH5224772 TaxID=1834083 RepID=UPI0018D2DEA5|nr:DUF262 domain-containing protein [Mycobacterium sp. 852002-10029_SCH5224772]